MYERLSDKNNIPTIEELISYIGSCKELFENIREFLTTELNAEIKLGFSRDSSLRAWGADFRCKLKYFCTIIAEKDAFLVVMRLTDDQIKKAYEEVSSYIQQCLTNYQRTSNGGWVQCRVLNTEQLGDVKKILKIRNK